MIRGLDDMTEAEAAERIVRELRRQAGDVVRTAQRLGVNRTSMWRLMQRLGLTPEVERARDLARRRFRLPPRDEKPADAAPARHK